MNESPGPACRLATMSGMPGAKMLGPVASRRPRPSAPLVAIVRRSDEPKIQNRHPQRESRETIVHALERGRLRSFHPNPDAIHSTKSTMTQQRIPHQVDECQPHDAQRADVQARAR